jgi:two-component system response regulator TctD
MIANLLEGMEHEEAARLAGLSRAAAYEWHNRYEEEGIEGLRDRPGPGRQIAAVNDLDRAGDIDWRRRLIMVAGKSRRLSATHWRLFTLLYGHRGDVVHADRIHAVLYREVRERPAPDIIREHIRNLRGVLAGSRYLIENHRGVGYELIAAVVPAAQKTEPPP